MPFELTLRWWAFQCHVPQKLQLLNIFTDEEGRRCMLLSVPKFSETGTCALVNLQTLAAEPMQFGFKE